MKHIVLVCLLLSCQLGLSIDSEDIAKSKVKTDVALGEASFLTSFIEDGKLYLTVPEHVLDKPMLFRRYDEIKGIHNFMQVKWSLLNDKVVLKAQSIKSTSGIIIPLKKGVPLMESILAVYPIKDKCADAEGYCINITDLILKQNFEWSQWSRGYTGNGFSQTSVMLGTKNLVDEVIVKALKGVTIDQSEVSIPVYFAFSELKNPMKARRFDYRMGFDNEKSLDISYGINAHGVSDGFANISKWRLEKKYKNQRMSVPINPITFILSPEIPKIWRPYIKAGIEEWLPAFGAAGFRNALVVKETDSLDDWERNRINNNIVYWGKQQHLRGEEREVHSGTIQNIVDYRTGEILKSDIYIGATRKNFEDRYFIRAGPLDKEAQTFPFPNDLVGKMFQCLTAHEVGHSLGLIDANFGESSYAVDNVTNMDWLKSMGYTPSIMNYTRPNNIAQPEDNIPPSLLVQKVGPADIYNIRWAYTEFPVDISTEDEFGALEKIVRLQDSIPWYRFTNGGHEVIGPAMTNEVVESNDPVKSTKLALKNLKRAIILLPRACINESNNTRMVDLYDQIIELWHNHMRHVVSVVGGYDIHFKSIDQPGKIYAPIKREFQIEAIDYLIENAFTPPNWLVNPDFISRIRYSVSPDRVLQYQQMLMMELLRAQRLKRFEFMDGTIEGYEGILPNYLDQLQSGLFQELKRSQANVNPRNQELQLTYIDKMTWIITQDRTKITVEEKAFDYTDHSKGIIMQQLLLLKEDIRKAVKKNKNGSSIGHWIRCLKKLNDLQGPKN